MPCEIVITEDRLAANQPTAGKISLRMLGLDLPMHDEMEILQKLLSPQRLADTAVLFMTTFEVAPPDLKRAADSAV